MGIAPEALPSLFSEFEQAEDAVRAARAAPGWGSPSRGAWRAPWAATSW